MLVLPQTHAFRRRFGRAVCGSPPRRSAQYRSRQARDTRRSCIILVLIIVLVIVLVIVLIIIIICQEQLSSIRRSISSITSITSITSIRSTFRICSAAA